MKKEIHPTYHPSAKISCACGNSITAGSTQKEIRVEICSACHPFFTGKAKLVDSAKRVNKFQKRLAKTEEAAKTRNDSIRRTGKNSQVMHSEVSGIDIPGLAVFLNL